MFDSLPATAQEFSTWIWPQAMAAEQKVKQKLIESGLQPRGFELPLRKLKTEAGLYRESNLPLLAELRKLSLEYDKISGALALGGTATLPELYAAAGVKFAFDAETLQTAVDLLERTIPALEPVAYP